MLQSQNPKLSVIILHPKNPELENIRELRRKSCRKVRFQKEIKIAKLLGKEKRKEQGREEKERRGRERKENESATEF